MTLPIVFRSHVKNDKRFALTKQTIESAIEVGIPKIAQMHLIDDHSSEEFSKELQNMCNAHNVIYTQASGIPHTRNGLVESLKISPTEPILCCVDDIVFSKHIVPTLLDIVNVCIPKLDENNVNWGLIGLFACYPRGKIETKYGAPLWQLKPECVYALVCHFFSPKLSQILIKDWDDILGGRKELTAHADDLWTATHLANNGLIYFNTKIDYAQHTGDNARSFEAHDGNDGSCYKTEFFAN